MSYYGPEGGGGFRRGGYDRQSNDRRPPWRGGGGRQGRDRGRGRSYGYGHRDSEGRRPLYNSNNTNNQSPEGGDSAAPQPQHGIEHYGQGSSVPTLLEVPIPRRGNSGTPVGPRATGAPGTSFGDNSKPSDPGAPPGTFPPTTTNTTNNDDEANDNDGFGVSMDWGLETERRNAVLDQMLQLHGSERFQAFRDLLPEEQLVLFFPDDVTSNSLPPMDPPTDWDQRVRKAIQTCKDNVRQLFRKRPHPQSHLHSNPYPEDSDDSAGSHSSPGGFNAPDPWEEEVAFVDALEYCIPMTAAFHVLTIFARAGDNKCCYCPCGKHMEKWRRFTSMQEFSTCDYKGRKDPASLWKHVLTKQEDCHGHRIVYWFLKTVFQDYHAEGIQHIALEDNQSPAYKKAERCIMKELKSQIDALKREAKEKHILEAQLKKAREDQATLQQINVELASKLEAEKKLKEKFGALQSTEEKLSPSQVQFARTQYDIFRQDVESTLERENIDKKQLLEPFISIGHGFNTIQVFQRWYNAFMDRGFGRADSSLDPKTFGFLFASTPYNKRPESRIRQAELRSQIGKAWEVLIKQDNSLIREVRAATGLDDFKTKDKGGPTRYFFSRLWNQLADLCVKIEDYNGNDGTIELFESCQGGLLPITDEKLQEYYLKRLDKGDRETVEAQIQSYFRAIGRILAHCMLKSIVVSTHVLPDLYKTVLLRGLDIEKEEYPLGVLIDHAGVLLEVDYSNKKEPPEMLLQRKLGLVDSDAHDSLPLRKQIKEIFVDNRKFSLEYLREGLTLGGTVNWRNLFGWVPTPTVNKLVFGRQDISEEMVFSSDGRLRFIRFEQDLHDKRTSIPYKALQNQFESRFTEFIRQKMQEDPTFISNFVEFCTGSPFLPDIDLNPDFHVRLEYNGSEMEQDFLPVVHTCDNCIKIPAQAYYADIEIFQEKLATVMRLSQTQFDMQ